MSRSMIVSRRAALATLAVLCTATGGLAFTHALAFAAALPDGRVVEMVTPAENHGADVYQPLIASEGELITGQASIRTRLPFQAAADGDAVAYVGDASTGGTGETGLGAGDEYLARRAVGGGWGQVDLQPPGLRSAWYQAFSSDLSIGIMHDGEGHPGFEEARISEVGASGSWQESPEVPRGGYKFLYQHPLNISENVFYPFFTTNPPNRSEQETSPQEFAAYGVPAIDATVAIGPAFAGASASFNDVFFEANDVLAPGAEDGGPDENNLYVSIESRTGLVNVLPGGGTEANATFGAPAINSVNNLPDFSHVISADGSRVFWTDLAPGANENRIFLRENPAQPQSPLANGACTVPGDACTVQVSAGAARYWTASTDGKYAFYTEAGGLYRFDAEDRVREELANPSAGTVGVIGASESGAYVYFVATEDLTGGEHNSQGVVAEAGQNNLYVLPVGGAPRFVATLSGMDDSAALSVTLEQGRRGLELGDWQPGLGDRTAEVTPSGEGLTFMSNNQSVEGYDPGLEEVYVYSYGADRLWCASCAPDHAQPEANNFSGRGLGAGLPVSWSYTYRQDWLSADGGRVVFDSYQPLVPEDVNGKPDVYEWERDGEGGCEQAEGCVYLLSGGTSESASWLAGESETGNDVFIISRAHLVQAGQGDEFALYDARVGGVEPLAPPACTGTGCQGVPAPPPVFATPPSVTFNGVGNFAPPAPAPAVVKSKSKSKSVRCRRGYVKEHGRCVRRKTAKKVASKSNRDRKVRS